MCERLARVSGKNENHRGEVTVIIVVVVVGSKLEARIGTSATTSLVARTPSGSGTEIRPLKSESKTDSVSLAFGLEPEDARKH